MKRNIALGLALLAMSLLARSMTMADGVFTATLIGTNETPPNASTATGFITVTLTGNTLSVAETFSGLTTTGSAAHIHCCASPGVAAGVAVLFTGFPAALAEATRRPST